MNLHQFRFVQEAVRQELNLTEVAKALHTSQPGVSKAILELESELGVDIFVRHGKRLRDVTEPGRAVLASIHTILREVANLKTIGQQFSAQDRGTLSIAATHTQARYVLPAAIAKLRGAYPEVNISLHQGTPVQVAQMVMEQVAEVGIATESLADYPDLVTLPCYEWQHMMILPQSHPLVDKLEAFQSVDSSLEERLRLEDVAAYPLITYHPSFTGRSRIDAAFAARGLQPQIALEAIDSDVIKTYVKLGLGIGIVAEMSVRGGVEEGLVVYPMGTLFGSNTTRIAFKKSAYLREFTLQFAEYLSERISRKLLLKALKGGNGRNEGESTYDI